MLYALELHELVDENHEPYAHYQLDPIDETLLEWPWLHGEGFNDTPPEPLARRFAPCDEDAGGLPDYQASPIPLVRARPRQVPEASGVADVEYYATTIDGADAFDDFPVYFAVNVVGKVSADTEGSVMTPTLGTTLMAASIDRPALPAAAARGQKLSRLAQHVATVFVDDGVCRACAAADIDTPRFIPAEEWAS